MSSAFAEGGGESVPGSPSPSPYGSYGGASLGGGGMPPSFNPRSHRNFSALLAVLRLLLRLVQHSSPRVRVLIQYKAPLIIRKAAPLPNSLLELAVLKLYKAMASQLGRKWKSANCKILTQIYMRLPPDLGKDYLAPDNSTNEEALLADRRMRKATDDFNLKYYMSGGATGREGTADGEGGAHDGESPIEFVARLLESLQVPEERNGAGGDRHFANGTSHSATSEDEEDDSTLSC